MPKVEPVPGKPRYRVDGREVDPQGRSVGLAMSTGQVVPGRLEFNHGEPERPFFVLYLLDPSNPIPSEATAKLPVEHNLIWLDTAGRRAKVTADRILDKMETLASTVKDIALLLAEEGAMQNGNELRAFAVSDTYRLALRDATRGLVAEAQSHNETRVFLAQALEQVAALQRQVQAMEARQSAGGV